MTYIIEKNIPIPGRPGKHSDVQDAIRQMEIGDSILCVGKTDSALTSIIQWARRRNDTLKICQRKVDGGSRLWRIA